MTTHHYNTTRAGKDVHVAMGFDAHANHPYLMVTFAGDTLTPLYSSTSDRALRNRQATVEYFVEVLAQLGVRVPQAMLDAVALDVLQQDTSNTMTEHFNDGRRVRIESE